MVEARLDRRNNTFEVELIGHANAGDHGSDIVCAAISVLACSLIAEVDSLMENGEADATFKQDAGYTYVECEVYNEDEMTFYDMFEEGIKGIADQYPNNLKII